MDEYQELMEDGGRDDGYEQEFDGDGMPLEEEDPGTMPVELSELAAEWGLSKPVTARMLTGYYRGRTMAELRSDITGMIYGN